MEMRRLALILAMLAALGTASGTTAATQPAPADPAAWASDEIAAVVTAGYMAPSVDEFRGGDVLTHAELAEILSRVSGTEQTLPNPDTPVSLRELDARLVKLVGLTPSAKAVRAAVTAAGIKSPSRLGSEVVARLLGLRTNHPEGLDGIELGPNSPATRAETAYSLARVLALTDDDKTYVTELVATFALPELSEWQRAILTRAFRFVGYPYIWGGSSEKPQTPFAVQVPGGFDCSGFVWRVYKTQAFVDAPSLADTLQGRTTYEMSGEVDQPQRIGYDALEPADVVFFGSKGTRSKPSQVGHMGIYVGNGWFVHSSGRGVTITPMTDWYRDEFAWARRPLAEAGLETDGVPQPAGQPQPPTPAEPTQPNPSDPLAQPPPQPA
jgi:cell wall-associated NlpC family hydrolase